MAPEKESIIFIKENNNKENLCDFKVTMLGKGVYKD